ncbi:MAG: ABC-F family ATP-binding cassette domain-containing protein [Desulfobacterales bacterium]|nr:ABC-F family ATP-binding cassette domain-containing protein [Desulfobacterales bacterium]
MIGIENLVKSFGGNLLLDGLTFKINPRERVGIVGRNGHGKTTLFKIIIGESSYDSGAISLPKNYRIGYVKQHLDFTRKNILEEAMLGLSEHEKDQSWKAEKILDGLGFSQDDMSRAPSAFSGGYQVRLNLAKELVAEPNLLLLDEPTNYLDITSIRWVEQFLNNWPNELMLITHDRSFMDKIVTDIVGIHRKKARKIAGTTDKYYEQIAQDEEVYEKTRQNTERRAKEIKLFVDRFRAKAKLASMVQSRVKALEKMDHKDKLESISALDFSFRSAPFPSKQVLRIEDLSFSYDDGEPLINNLNTIIGARERICVIGKNGKGKTTLLKLLAGKLKPNSGELKYHPKVIQGFYEQTNVSELVDTRTVAEELLYSHPDTDQQHARNICGAMMFEGDNALKKISVLSGGEKSRVMLGKLLVTPLNLLLLDEPTNHLDMDACDALIAAIDHFEGTVIMVTHNEMFLHALADRLIVFKNNQVNIFDGSYQAFLEKEGWESAVQQAESVEEKKQKNENRISKKDLRRMRSEIITQKGKELGPLEKRISKIENEIETREKQLETLNSDMMEASGAQAGKRIADISQALHLCHAEIDAFFDELETETLKHDELKEKFDQQLDDMEADF